MQNAYFGIGGNWCGYDCRPGAIHPEHPQHSSHDEKSQRPSCWHTNLINILLNAIYISSSKGKELCKASSRTRTYEGF